MPQGFVCLTMICKDFQGMKEIIYFCQKNKFTKLAKKKLTKLTKKINLPDLPKKYQKNKSTILAKNKLQKYQEKNISKKYQKK